MPDRDPKRPSRALNLLIPRDPKGNRQLRLSVPARTSHECHLQGHRSPVFAGIATIPPHDASRIADTPPRGRPHHPLMHGPQAATSSGSPAHALCIKRNEIVILLKTAPLQPCPGFARMPQRFTQNPSYPSDLFTNFIESPKPEPSKRRRHSSAHVNPAHN